MLRIVTHIERLLLVHDCVIVPKLGGFVLQDVSAQWEQEEHAFRPSRKEIGFNATLQHTDGLLCESYMQQYAVNYQQALWMLEEDVEEIKRQLQRDGTLSLDELGTFSLGEEGQLIFRPGRAERFSIDSYGLPLFYFPVLTSLQHPHEETAEPVIAGQEQKKDTFYIPVSRRLLRTVAASAAAVTLFLLVSTPVKEVNPDTYTASFVPTEVVMPKVSPVNEQKAETETSLPMGNEVANPVEKPENKRPEPVQTAAKKQVPAKTYHVVIASFPTRTQADEYLAGVNRKDCTNPGIVTRGGKCRIYADKFDNREAAEAYLSALRIQPEYKDAWLFICR